MSTGTADRLCGFFQHSPPDNRMAELIGGNILAIATAALGCTTFQGKAALESNAWNFVLNDEAQVLASREGGLYGHLLSPCGLYLWSGDNEQLTPHELASCRRSELGQILHGRMGLGLSNALPPSPCEII